MKKLKKLKNHKNLFTNTLAIISVMLILTVIITTPKFTLYAIQEQNTTNNNFNLKVDIAKNYKQINKLLK